MSVTIRLQNLPMSANAADIRRFFTGLTIPEGGVHIVGGEQGDAFIAFATDEDARKAMLLDRTTINNTVIRLFLSSKNEMQSVIQSARNNVLMYSSTQSAPSMEPPVSNLAPPAHVTAYNHVPDQPYSRYLHYPEAHVDKQPLPQPSYPPVYSNSNGAPYSHENPPLKYSQPPVTSHLPQRPLEDPYNRGQPVPSRAYPYENIPNAYPPPPARPYSPRNNHFDDPRANRVLESEYFERRPQYETPPVDPRMRPPWKDEEERYSKRPFDSRYPPESNIVPPFKDRRQEVKEYVVRLSIKPVEVSVMSILDFVKGVDIVSKYGVRVELDTIGRPTGYVYLLLMNSHSFDNSMKLNGKQFKGYNVVVRPSSMKEFWLINDPSFMKRCPEELMQNIPRNLLDYESPYTKDAYLELTDLPPDTSEMEIIEFIGAPGLSVRDVVLLNYPPKESRSHLRALIKLPSPEDVPILMSARPRPLRVNQNLGPVHLVPISRQQFDYMIQDSSLIVSKLRKPLRATEERNFSRFSDDRNSPSRFSDRGPPPLKYQEERLAPPASSRSEKPNGSGDSPTCIHITNLARTINKQELIDNIKSHRLLMDDVITFNREAIITCESSVISKRVYDELKNPSNPFFKVHYKMFVLRISRDQFERIISSSRSSSSDPPQMPGQDEVPFRDFQSRGPTPESWSNKGRPPHPDDRSRMPRLPARMPAGPPIRPADSSHMKNDRNNWSGPNRNPIQQNRNLCDTRIHLSSLPTGINSHKISDFLRPFNPIPSSVRVLNGRNGTFAVAAFDSPSEAEAAIKFISSNDIEGKRIFARYDTEFKPRNQK